jgi:hypothetical protein
VRFVLRRLIIVLELGELHNYEGHISAFFPIPLVSTFLSMKQSAMFCGTEVCPSDLFNPSMPNDLLRRRAVSPLNIQITSKQSEQAALGGEI